MKKLAFLFLMMSMCFSISAQNQKTYDVSDFEGLTISGNADVVLMQGSQYKVEARGSKNALEKLKIKADDGSLMIGSRKSDFKGGDVTVYVTAPEINGIVISGSGDLSMKDDFKQEKFSVVVSGSGDVSLKGESNKLSIVVSGSGDIDAFDFSAKKCSIVNSGSGDVKIHVSDKLSVVCSGSGDVTYKGDPKKSIVSSGSGEVERS